MEEYYKIDKDLLYVTVYTGDDDAKKKWIEVGIDPEHILFLQFHDADRSNKLGNGTSREYGAAIHRRMAFLIGGTKVFCFNLSRRVRPRAACTREKFRDPVFHSLPFISEEPLCPGCHILLKGGVFP